METKQSSIRETDKWIRGHAGELTVSNLLEQQGWFVIPSYDYTGEDDNKAPRLKGLSACYVIPDLDTARKGERRWVEVKTKKEATWFRMLERYEHGIPRKHYEHYLKVQEITGTLVYLFVYEETTGIILYALLNDLSKYVRFYEGNKMSYGGMAFFPRDKFIVFANVKVNK